jgi:hypothetical protein
LERFQKYRKDCELPPVTDDTSSHCEARQRLPEGVVWELARRSGQSIDAKADGQWFFAGRPVKLLDGPTVIMPDTKANQAEVPWATGCSAITGSSQIRSLYWGLLTPHASLVTRCARVS